MIDGDSNLSCLKRSVYWVKSHCDSDLKINKDLVTNDYKEVLKNRCKNPTLTDIVFYDNIKKRGVLYPRDFYKNLKALEEDRTVHEIADLAIKKIMELYPKTRIIRKQLIEKGRFELNSVTPKMTKIQKLLFVI